MPTITASPQPTATPPRVALTVSGLSGSVSALARRDPDGSTSPVRAALSAAASGSQWTGYDYEAPRGVSVRYELDTATSAPVTMSGDDVWLVHPLVPARSLRIASAIGFGPVVIEAVGERTRKVTSASLQPLGRSTPIVWTDGVRRRPELQVRLRTASIGAEDSLLALLEDGCPLLIAPAPSLRLGLSHGYVAVGDVAEEHDGDYGLSLERTWTLPCTTVARPAGVVSLVSQWTWDDVVVNVTSWDQVLVRYATWNDLANNVRQDLPVIPEPPPVIPGGPPVPDPGTGTGGGTTTPGTGTGGGTTTPGTGTGGGTTTPGTGTGGGTTTPTIRTWDDVAVVYASWEEVLRKYATWADLAAGVERPFDVPGETTAGNEGYLPDFSTDYLDDGS